VAAVVVAVWAHRIQLWSSLHARDYISYAFDTRVDAILVGCLLAIALREGMGRKILGWACESAWAPVATVLLIAGSTLAGRWNTLASEGYRLTVGLAIEPFLVAVLICQLIVQSKAGAWKWLNSSVTGYLGRISYPLYLYHGLAAAVAIRLVGTNKIACVVTTVLLSIVVASGSYYLVERPFLALKKGRVKPINKLEPSPLATLAPST
jgi:peptidoglycan/LPS O-acetylase OafA/YrhL